MTYVKAKKALGQHFLKDEAIAKRIVDSLIIPDNQSVQVLEIGPGTGVLTKYLLENPQIKLELSEIDTESIDYLKENYTLFKDNLSQKDFLKTDVDSFFIGDFFVIGNFPYNISSQIFFKILDDKERIPQIVCMLQREVAQRLASEPGNKSYGILSVLLQAWYNIEYLFTVNENVFIPPPKVKSGVIRLTRNDRVELGCNEELFKRVIKTCFNQRRKTIRNSIKPIITNPEITSNELFNKRPEQLSVDEFIELTKLIQP